MFPLPALITREPRPADRSVAQRPGHCLHNIGTLFDTPPSCMSRKRRGLSGPPPPRSAMKFAGNRIFRR